MAGSEQRGAARRSPGSLLTSCDKPGCTSYECPFSCVCLAKINRVPGDRGKVLTGSLLNPGWSRVGEGRALENVGPEAD